MVAGASGPRRGRGVTAAPTCLVHYPRGRDGHATVGSVEWWRGRLAGVEAVPRRPRHHRSPGGAD